MKAIRRRLLALVLGTIAVTAALGLYAVLVPNPGETQGKILGTSAVVSAASVLVLACLPAWERRLLGWLPAVAAIGVVIAAALVVGGMWSETEREGFWKTMGTVLVPSLWGVLACLLALSRLAPRYRWAFGAAVLLTAALALLGVLAIWTQPASDTFGRVVGAFAVLSAAFVVAVPVLHRASRGEMPSPDARSAGRDGARFCPRCGAEGPVETAARELACRRCGARFRVSFVD